MGRPRSDGWYNRGVPELPEVETIRRQLEPELVGRRIESLKVLDPRWTEPVPPREVERACSGRLIESVGRRGKWLLVGLEGERWLVMHLRMTGNLVLVDAGRDGDERFLRVVIALDDGRRLLFTDARRFGTGVVVDDSELEGYLRPRAGIEPLSAELTAEALGRLAAGRRAPLKSFLMVQSGIAGIGNIYADEALWRARLHPLSPAGSMRPEHWEALRVGIVDTLEAGLASGGASVDDYRDARGEEGSMQDEFLVHTREGQPCPRCGATIRRIVLAGRSTYFCPDCQTRLRRRRRGTRRVAAATRS
jgi:formamidopyrimidine-DNA glycosylase